ncbi:MAG: RNA polymerase sigma factor [Steroidobacteraceae bacterium]|nr:RNA polymerase sigma factor [Steroidobacteraceae bacterium]
MTEQGAESEFELARRAAEERALVESAKRGSRTAFEALYRNHVGKVYGLCLRMTAHRATAEDCTQEAFIQAWRSLPTFENRSAFGTWLHRIAVNAVLGQGRRRRERLGEDESAEDEAVALADLTVADQGTVLDLEAGIRGLPAGARQALVLVGLYGHTHEEAAQMLGIAVGTCKSQVHRARQLLGERLAVTEVAQ